MGKLMPNNGFRGTETLQCRLSLATSASFARLQFAPTAKD